MPPSKPPYTLSLHTRHAHQVLEIRQVGAQLRQLRVEVGLLGANVS